ncbi:MAG: EAL domain-containing protein [Rhodospirillales bacterium]|nr:EAL domain-containing protein [Rhodospirillales bacterium]
MESCVLAGEDHNGPGPCPGGLDPGLAGPVPLAELQEALALARIRTLYQPIVRIRDRAPVAVEVLARLAHPTRGLVEPDLFVPQFEEAGLALPLTEAVARLAFGEWHAGALEQLGISLALNFPLDVLLMPAALNWLDRERERAGIPAHRVTIELTESRPVSRLAELGAAVSRLRRAGYQLAIDDVGPDLRDHRELLALEFSSLKLDKNLVQDAMRSPVAAAFLDRASAAARQAGMLVVAEGVADAEIWARVAALPVDQAQGYFVARPMAAASVADWQSAWLERPPFVRLS